MVDPHPETTSMAVHTGSRSSITKVQVPCTMPGSTGMYIQESSLKKVVVSSVMFMLFVLTCTPDNILVVVHFRNRVKCIEVVVVCVPVCVLKQKLLAITYRQPASN